jgi:hypothetical protein
VQTAAAVAAQALLHTGDARFYKTKPAPGPDDVNWSALWCSSDERLGRRMLAGLFYFLIMCIPLGAFAQVLTKVCTNTCSQPCLPPVNLFVLTGFCSIEELHLFDIMFLCARSCAVQCCKCWYNAPSVSTSKFLGF